ncbi:MAG: DUF3575 domain-containing protein [Bacteroidales bacterium]|nr:DUF3575 domain-containing protein [Bacteroidales bacterium]
MNALKALVASFLLLFGCVFSKAYAQDFSLSTNLASLAELGTLNAEAGVGLSRHVSLNAGLRYNPFVYSKSGTGDTVQDKKQSYAVGAKFWLWHLYSGWWLGSSMQYEEFSEGGFRSKVTSEGDRYGSTISAGYSYLLGKHFNLDLGLGMWGGWEKYVSYSCPTCGEKVDSGNKVFFLPDAAIVAISYIF